MVMVKHFVRSRLLRVDDHDPTHIEGVVLRDDEVLLDEHQLVRRHNLQLGKLASYRVQNLYQQLIRRLYARDV